MRLTSFALAVALMALSCGQLPAEARVKVEDSIVVNAEPEHVWKALSQYQNDGKRFHKKQVVTKENSIQFSEEFAKMPFVGTTYIDYVEVSNPKDKRIDYKLKSAKFLNVFEGAWIVEENKNGDGAVVRLTTDIDSWICAPLKNKVLKNMTKKGMEERLAYVKEHAERLSGGSGGTKISNTSNPN